MLFAPAGPVRRVNDGRRITLRNSITPNSRIPPASSQKTSRGFHARHRGFDGEAALAAPEQPADKQNEDKTAAGRGGKPEFPISGSGRLEILVDFQPTEQFTLIIHSESSPGERKEPPTGRKRF